MEELSWTVSIEGAFPGQSVELCADTKEELIDEIRSFVESASQERTLRIYSTPPGNLDEALRVPLARLLKPLPADAQDAFLENFEDGLLGVDPFDDRAVNIEESLGHPTTRFVVINGICLQLFARPGGLPFLHDGSDWTGFAYMDPHNSDAAVRQIADEWWDNYWGSATRTIAVAGNVLTIAVVPSDGVSNPTTDVLPIPYGAEERVKLLLRAIRSEAGGYFAAPPTGPEAFFELFRADAFGQPRPALDIPEYRATYELTGEEWEIARYLISSTDDQQYR